MVLSPIFMTMLPPCLKVFLSITGSSAGSSDSSTFSMTKGLPKRTAFSMARRNSLSDGLPTSTPASAHMFLIHLLACPCGSMQSGHRKAEARMMPFSVDRPSAGSPCTCHARSLTGSAITLISDAPSVCGTSSDTSCARQSAQRSSR